MTSPVCSKERQLVVLVVDDHPDCREALAMLLEVHGFHVITASDGREGLSLALANRPDAIVTDIQMPVMDGFAFASAVRGDERLRDTFILAVSAHVATVQGAAFSDFDHHLSKPAEVIEILTALNNRCP